MSEDNGEAAELVRVSLLEMVEHYTALVNSGDAGNWNPEEELPVIRARHALALSKGSDV